MKIILLILGLFITTNYGQDFVVEKLKGSVKYLSMSSENWLELEKGQKLQSSDLILTDNNSYVHLRSGNNLFVLESDAALGLDKIKKISINELILALTLDEIRNVPSLKGNNYSKSTAVYGSDQTTINTLKITENSLGEKKMKGAKLLSQRGYTESSIILAQEIFRYYPNTAQKFDDRLYFADLMKKLNLYKEADEEYLKMENLDLNDDEKQILANRREEVSIKLLENN